MTVYIDIIIAENLVLDYVILYATGIIYKMRPKSWRLFISSFIGSIYAILSYMQILEIYPSLILKIILSVSMVYIAFNPKNIKTLVKQLIIFYLTSFIFGGVAFALLYFLKPQDILLKNGVYIGSYPLKTVFLGAIVGLAVITAVFKIVKGKITRKDLFCKINIKIFDNKAEATAMIDTGNFLKEPITGADVIVVEKTCLEGVLPDNILSNLNRIIKGEYKTELGKYEARLRIIPFSSLGKQNGLLLGIKADEIFIETEEGPIYVCNAIIGIYENILSHKGQYNALIGLDILEGGNQFEFDRAVKKQY